MTTTRAIWATALLSVVFGLAQLPALGRMEDHGAGVLCAEFVATSDRARDMLSGWGSEGRDAAKEHLYLDYPYLLAYGLFFFGACTAVARRFEARGRERAASLGRTLALAGLAGAGFDALENASLLVVLDDHTGQPWPALATAFASVKFALTTPAFLYSFAGRVITR